MLAVPVTGVRALAERSWVRVPPEVAEMAEDRIGAGAVVAALKAVAPMADAWMPVMVGVPEYSSPEWKPGQMAMAPQASVAPPGGASGGDGEDRSIG